MTNSVKILVNGSPFNIRVLSKSKSKVKFELEGREYLVEFEESAPQGSAAKNKESKSAVKHSNKIILAGVFPVVSPIPGLISKINVELGQKINIGDPLLQIEAMKMQNTIFAEVEGVVNAIDIGLNQEVSAGAVLLEILCK